MCRCAYCLNEFRSGDLLEITKEFAMKNLNFAAVFFLFAYVIGSSWARDGDGEVDPGGPTRESDCWVTVWSTACTLCGEGPRILTLCGDDMCEDDVFTEQASDTKKFKFGYEECALSGTNAQCIIVRYNCVNNRCEEGISNVWYISNSVATGEVCEGGGVVIDP